MSVLQLPSSWWTSWMEEVVQRICSAVRVKAEVWVWWFPIGRSHISMKEMEQLQHITKLNTKCPSYTTNAASRAYGQEYQNYITLQLMHLWAGSISPCSEHVSLKCLCCSLEIWGISCFGLVAYDTTESSRWVWMFWRNILPPPHPIITS